MSKFGDIIDAKIPILLSFYSDLDESTVEMHAVLRDVAAAMGDHGKVIKLISKKTLNSLKLSVCGDYLL